MRVRFYLPISLLHVLSRRAKARNCSCGKPAEYVQADLFEYSEPTKLSGGANWNSCYCGECIGGVAKKRQMEIVVDEARIRDIHRQMCAEKQSAFEEMRQRNIARKAEEMATKGRVLLMSGHKGGMYEMADGALQCELVDGSITAPCCSAEGARIIDNRVGGRPASGHSDGCTMGQLKGN